MRIKSIHEKQELLKIKKKYHIRGEGKPPLKPNQLPLEMLKIQKIQRRVREWLLKRQKYDIESASEMLHSAFLSDNFKKSATQEVKHFDEKEAAILIQRTVKKWLVSQHKE